MTISAEAVSTVLKTSSRPDLAIVDKRKQRENNVQALANLPAEGSNFASSQGDDSVSNALQQRSSSSGTVRTATGRTRNSQLTPAFWAVHRRAQKDKATRSAPLTEEERALAEEERDLVIEEKRLELAKRKKALADGRRALDLAP